MPNLRALPESSADAVWLRPRSAAKLIDVSLRTLYRWVEQGFLPKQIIKHRVGVVLVNREALLKWIEQG